MIPKKIHYCWFGKGPLTDLNRRCLETWHRVLSDYEIKEWNESNSPLDDEYCRACYGKGEWSKLSNYTRLHALYSEGGIYLDTDVQVIKDFAPLLVKKCFLGFQQEEEQVDWVNSAVLGAEREHHFLKQCMSLTQELFALTGVFPRSPAVFTTVLKGMGLKDYLVQEVKDVTVYPAEYFYPYPWFGKFTPACVTEKTYCIHHWEWSWRKKNHNPVMSSLRAIKKMVLTAMPKLEQ